MRWITTNSANTVAYVSTTRTVSPLRATSYPSLAASAMRNTVCTSAAAQKLVGIHARIRARIGGIVGPGEPIKTV